jgi:hypothetical protein
LKNLLYKDYYSISTLFTAKMSTSKPIKFTVSFLDHSEELTLDPNTIIEDIVNLVGAKFLAKEEKRLESGRCLSDYDIKDGDTIFAVARQRCLICAEMETKKKKNQQQVAELTELLSSLTPDQLADFLKTIPSAEAQPQKRNVVPCMLVNESDYLVSALSRLVLFDATTGVVDATTGVVEATTDATTGVVGATTGVVGATTESNKTSPPPSDIVVAVSDEDISDLYG